jgi:chromate reductase
MPWSFQIQTARTCLGYCHSSRGKSHTSTSAWVRSGELYQKPVALINASPRSMHAQASLAETLTTRTARLVPEACLTIALPGKHLDAFGICRHPEISRALPLAMTALARAAAPVARR